MRPVIPVLIFMLLLPALFVLSVSTGSVKLPFGEVMDILLGGQASHASWSYIVEDRLSRALLAMATGAGLSLAGLIMQSLFRNALAGPGVLGVSAGASVGAAAALLVGGGLTGFASGYVGLVGASAAGAMLVLLVVIYVARVFHDSASVLITGLMLTFFTSALVSVMLHNAQQTEVQRYVMWGFGSLAGVPVRVAWMVLTAIVVLIGVSFLFHRKLDMLLLGQQQAELSGMNVVATRRMLIILTGLITAIITAFCGPIGFIGIAVPHLVRLMKTGGLHRTWIPLSLLVGANLTLLCDVASRIVVPLPLNAVTSVIGAPVVVWILIMQRKKGGVWI